MASPEADPCAGQVPQRSTKGLCLVEVFVSGHIAGPRSDAQRPEQRRPLLGRVFVLGRTADLGSDDLLRRGFWEVSSSPGSPSYVEFHRKPQLGFEFQPCARRAACFSLLIFLLGGGRFHNQAQL